MKRFLKMLFFVGITFSIIGQDSSFIMRQLDRLANSKVVKDLSELRFLPSAIKKCYIVKSECTDNDRQIIQRALVQIPAIMGTFALATGIVWKISKDDSKKASEKPKLSDLPEETRQKFLNAFATVINRSDFKLVEKGLSQARFDQKMIDDYLALAVQTSMPEVVELLLKYGANPSMQDLIGNSPIWMAARRAIFTPSEAGLAEEMIDLLLKYKANVNLQGENGMTALMWAAEAGLKSIVNKLINAGANPNIKDNKGKSAFGYASEYPEIKDMLASGA